jgi:SecD/SecF fusion protein
MNVITVLLLVLQLVLGALKAVGLVNWYGFGLVSAGVWTLIIANKLASERDFWKWALVVFLAVWAAFEVYPLKARDLIEVFQERAEASDTNFTAIVKQARSMQQTNANQPFLNLLTAVGTNDLRRYFPSLAEETEGDQNRLILNRIQQKAAGKVKLGLDLQGGTSFLVSLDTTRLTNVDYRPAALNQAVEVLRKRVDKFGIAEPLIQPVGDNRILIQLPGLTEAEKVSAKSQIQKAAFLEFRIVHPESDALLKQDIIEPGYEVKVERRKRQGTVTEFRYLVKKEPERGLTGKYVDKSWVTLDSMTGEPKISLKFNSEGASLFGDITREHVGHCLAIILDGELYSAPVIREPIMGGNCEISGSFELAEAHDLANVLENPLEAPVHIEEERGVDPSLGKDSIQSGIKASLIGTIAVVIFMLVYYFKAGAVANVALLLNIVILLGCMCTKLLGGPFTFTLPGIAGVVLTIGMAVDANVLIYERIREELAAGKSLKGAVAAGYDRAFTTILDSNVTTLIASIILIYMGTGSVQGFGRTLTIGIIVSMFTALVVTRLIFNIALDRGWLKTLPMLHLIRGSKFDFMKFAKVAFVSSWVLIAIGMTVGIVRGKGALGVDFRGGDRLGLRFEKKIEVDRIRDVMAKLKAGDALIQYQKELSTGKESLQITTEVGSGEKVEQALKEQFPAAKFDRISLDQVGATVGREIQKTALLSTFLAMFGILVYVAFRYEFSFAVGAVLALVHDIFMTLGWYFIMGREMNATLVAAILTIIGFSVNDTIVIFDRIRENLKLGVRGSFREVINQALNQTLSRTIITSGTVFLATLALFIFGGGVINDFSFAFLIGIVTGTYSSIYIATALVLFWHKGERPKLGTQVAVQSVAPVKV